MGRKGSLTKTQWAQARSRWEGCTTVGFQWLAREIEAAWGVTITRACVGLTAKREGWAKGGAMSGPLAEVAPAERPQKPAPSRPPAPARIAAQVQAVDDAVSLASRLRKALTAVVPGAGVIMVIVLPAAHHG